MVVGGLLVLLGSLNINKERDQRKADVVNDVSTGLVFIITILNVVISGFGLESYPQMLKNLHREDIVEPWGTQMRKKYSICWENECVKILDAFGGSAIYILVLI